MQCLLYIHLGSWNVSPVKKGEYCKANCYNLKTVMSMYTEFWFKKISKSSYLIL